MRFLRAELLITLDCCQSHDCTAEWLRREEAVGGGPESPSSAFVSESNQQGASPCQEVSYAYFLKHVADESSFGNRGCI